MLRRPLLVVLATCLCLAGSLFGPAALRLTCAVALLTILPGVAITDMLFGRSHFDWAERSISVIALAIATVVLGGLALDITVGLTRVSLAYYAAAVTIVAAIVSAFVGGAGDPAEPSTRVSVHVSAKDVAMFAVAGVIAVAAVGFAHKPLSARGVHGYTALWIDPSGDGVELGVRSQELHPTAYRLVVAAGAHVVRRWQIELAPGEQWRRAVVRQKGARAMNAVLYVRAAGTWGVYRRVRTLT
jgi:hypothetical protein